MNAKHVIMFAQNIAQATHCVLILLLTKYTAPPGYRTSVYLIQYITIADPLHIVIYLIISISLINPSCTQTYHNPNNTHIHTHLSSFTLNIPITRIPLSLTVPSSETSYSYVHQGLSGLYTHHARGQNQLRCNTALTMGVCGLGGVPG